MQYNEAATIILENLALAYYSKDYTQMEQILEMKSINWGVFVEQAIKHKLLPLAWLVLKSCSNFEEKIPFYLREFLANNFYMNQHKMKLYYKHVPQVVKLLKANNIEFVVVKGISLEKLIYNNNSVKVISDVDMLINQGDYDTVCDLLKKENIIAGTYDYITNTISKHTREKYLFFRLTKDHLPDHLIKTNDEVCPVVKVDISTNSNWIDKKSIDFLEMVMTPQTYELEVQDEFIIPVLNHSSHFIYILLHLYRHAWSYRFISRNISVRIGMFNDLVLYWLNFKKEIIEELPSLIQDKVLKEQVAWVLYHADKLFNLGIMNELGLTVDQSSINLAYGKNNKFMVWEGDIRNRLWSNNEISLFKERKD